MSAPTYRHFRVVGQILDGNLFDDTTGIDVRASTDRYVALLTQELQDRYPGVTVDLSIVRNTSGSGRDLEMVDRNFLPMESPDLHEISERVFERGDWLVEIGEAAR